MHHDHDEHHGHHHEGDSHHHHEEHSHHPHEEHSHSHEHEGGESTAEPSQTARLRKMVEHWVSHNEDHAASYRLWAGRAREAGCSEPGRILEEIASETIEQNKKFIKIIELIDSSR